MTVLVAEVRGGDANLVRIYLHSNGNGTRTNPGQTNPGQTNPGQTNPGHDKPWTRQTLDMTNPGHDKPWTQ
jgi:hypothetical protein